MTKPFAFEELVARLHALIKRGGTDLSVQVGGLRLDPGTHAATCGGSIAELSGVGREVKAVIDFDDEAVGRKTIKLAYTTLERGQE